MKFSNDVKEKNLILSERLGWTPDFFGCSDFNDELFEKIVEFQEKYDLKPDGIAGNLTYRRIRLELDEERERGFIYCHKKKVDIDWPHTVTFRESPRWEFPEKNWRRSSKRTPDKIIIHWDVCTSAEKCHDVLFKNGTSTHFIVDNDGQVIQCLDTKYIGEHALGANLNAIGIDLSCAYYPKFNKYYEKKGHGPRPLMEGYSVHGEEKKPFLGFYSLQVDALVEIVVSLVKRYDIDVWTPPQPKKSVGLSEELTKEGRSGIYGHYHLNPEKQDPLGLDFEDLIRRVKEKL